MDNNSQTLTLPWLQATCISNLGPRNNNEDRYLLSAWGNNAVLAAVADGIGGHQGGEIAAQIAIDTLQELLDSPLPEYPEAQYNLLLDSFRKADQKIREQSSQSFALMGMGTTLLAAIFTEENYMYMYAGDCRLYHFQAGELVRKSADHSIVQVLLELERITEEDIATHPMRSKINSCLGGRDATGQFSIDPKWHDQETPVYPVDSNNTFILCSDGLHSAVLTNAVTEIVNSLPNQPKELSEELVKTALENDGKDNITIVCLSIITSKY